MGEWDFLENRVTEGSKGNLVILVNRDFPEFLEYLDQRGLPETLAQWVSRAQRVLRV